MTVQKKIEKEYDLFLQEKPKNILIYIKKENKPLYTSIIAREVNTTYAHTFNVLKRLERLKLVSFKESGRIKLIRLTELGDEVAKVMINMLDLLELGELENELQKTHENEIKGKLREQMNKEQISKNINKLKDKLAEFSKNKQDNILVMSKKLSKRIDDTLAEAFGYPQG
ncbi:MAG: winged helix DNA-binding protein [Methanobacteriota archaeon]